MTTIAIGTEKGAFFLEGRADHWTVRGPLFPGWKVTAWGTAADGHHLAALASNWFGVSVHRSPDLRRWTQVDQGPRYPEGHHRRLEQIWTLDRVGDALYAGVAQAGLFRSSDHGDSWKLVAGLDRYPGAESWTPGLGGLAAHHLLQDGNRLWVGVSAVGVLRSDDGGDTWARYDEGVTPVVDPTAPGGPGFCVHGLAHDPGDPDRLWRQDHSGVYRSFDGAESWERIESGLPASFGFPMLRDPTTGRLFVVPLDADTNRLPPSGRFRVWRSDNDGTSWQESGTGFPTRPTFTTVLRNAATTDGEGGVFLGTTGGEVWASSDAGDHWLPLPITTPRILSLHAFG